MRKCVVLIILAVFLAACGARQQGDADIVSQLREFQHLPGYFDLYWDAGKGRLIIRIDAFEEPFLYQSSLARGIGSNDIGLDRGQLGATKIVAFHRSGPKILLIEDNLDYRAGSDDVAEQNAVEESFARAVIWGFTVLGERDGSVYIDATDFMLRDAHSIAARLAELEEGAFKPDASRSAIYMPNTKAFPDNSEVEAIVTFTGEASGEQLPTVTPDWQTITVHLHHSLIRLPDDNADTQVRAIALDAVYNLDDWLVSGMANESDSSWRAHYVFARFRIERMRNDPAGIEQIVPVTTPPGEPIGETLDWR